MKFLITTPCDDYPVRTRIRDDGLLVIGAPEFSLQRYSVEIPTNTITPTLFWFSGLFLVMLICVLGASALLLRRWFRKDQSRVDAARAEWVNGVSHDIRTPLSMVLGYASELEDDGNLPPDARKQAGIIRRESEKMKRLIDDLNLTTKLEYALQPVHFKDVDWVETSRQAVSEVLNGGLDSRYEIAFAEMQPGRSIHLLGDDGLLRRMLDNLIRNSITHNPQGCKISVSVGEENGRCLCTVSDDGIGIAPERLKVLNRGDDITSTQGSDEKNEHGLGLKLVMQIVKAHRGTVSFSGSTPHGLEVRISLPTQPLIS